MRGGAAALAGRDRAASPATTAAPATASTPARSRTRTRRTLGIVQVESPAAVAAAPELAAIDGIDVLFVGPSDLSYSMGIPGEFEHPDFRAAIARVVAAARDAGKAAGVMTATPAAISAAAADGFRMIACSTELGLMVDAVRGVAAAARAL